MRRGKNDLLQIGEEITAGECGEIKRETRCKTQYEKEDSAGDQHDESVTLEGIHEGAAHVSGEGFRPGPRPLPRTNWLAASAAFDTEFQGHAAGTFELANARCAEILPALAAFE